MSHVLSPRALFLNLLGLARKLLSITMMEKAMQSRCTGRAALVLTLLVAISCTDSRAGRVDTPAHPAPVVPEQPAVAAANSARATIESARRARQADGPPRPGEALLYVDGTPQSRIGALAAEEQGLTVVDLSDGWLPFVLSEQPELGPAGAQPYAASYRALADERFQDAPGADRAAQDRFLELYGISPDFRVLAARLDDDARAACHDAVDDAALAQRHAPLRPDYENLDVRRRLLAIYDLYTGKLARARATAGVATNDALPDTRDVHDARLRVAQVGPSVEPVLALQAHLRCDGLLSRRAERGIYDLPTMLALKAWQREQFVVGVGVVDDETRDLLVSDRRELVFRALLRALRERVADATGLVEDGSAANAWGTVLGRDLDAREMHEIGELEPPLENGAPDLISPATEAAARALGWTSPDAARAFFARLGAAERRDLHVAVRLPPPPSWQTPHMDLRAVIDRGDVWYDYPYNANGTPRPQPVAHRPTLVMYAHEGDHDVALVRWPTTIGGWKPEQLPGGRVGLRYKESEPGARVWRDLVATPTWSPPASTPDDELVHRDWAHGYSLTRDLVGPSYASAYGLVMLVQHKVLPQPDGAPPVYFDRGIRSHGSVSYGSILHGQSHGCHRLFNHLAIRLASYLLAHRDHVRRGPSDADYQRTVRAHGRSFDLRIPTRGMVWELSPPVPVLVRRGNVLGHEHEAIRGMRPLATALAARAEAAAAADDE